MSDPLDYTVGCICALPEENASLQAFLDARHDGPKYVSTNDNNDYTLGRIGKHNVVICALPSNQYGLTAAATVARDLAHSFPNIRIGLMVGIAGGAPNSRSDIRLGDVVVGVSSDGNPAVFQYDYGKAVQDHGFQAAGFINQPPQILLTAVSGLKAFYEIEGERLEESIKMALDRRPRMKQKYQRPDASTDRLYRSDFVHPDADLDCSQACGNDQSRLRNRKERDSDGPMIHYGLIASSNSLIKDALVRDGLTKKKGMLCFEMEAAGLLNHFPCLVIRGICDYSDSHKNKKWQGYAAMTAAAYARDLLGRIAPSRLEVEKKIADLDLETKKAIQQHLDLSKQQLNYHKDQALSKKEQACHQLFRLAVCDRDSTYEWYKDRIANRIEGTCSWFIQHSYFQDWLARDSGTLLISADPGCGKSVLAKYLIDVMLPRESSICYFFFKDQDQNTMRQALCALLHQLFYHRPALLRHALAQIEVDGENLIHSTASLWKVFETSVKDPQAGSVIIILDAIDECTESDLTALVARIEAGGSYSQDGSSRVRWLLTCRPYDQIISRFSRLLLTCPQIHVPGEDESEAICEEVNRVILYRVNELSELKSLTTRVKDHLCKRLQEITHRTYLWVYLVFEHLQQEGFKKTERGVDAALMMLPKSISEAYDQILRKSKAQPMVQRVLCIILAASRPLSVSEVNTAMNVNYDSQSIESLDLEEEGDFRARLRDWCGLFISIYNGKVYLLHQTAREFLLADSRINTEVLPELSWHHSITITSAHYTLAEICVLYLSMATSGSHAKWTHNDNTASGNFFHYAALNWGDHFHLADMKIENPILPFTLRICDPLSESYKAWFLINWSQEKRQQPVPLKPTSLTVASYLGHPVTAELMLKRGDNVDGRDDHDQTPLFWAACKGSAAVTSLLLENGANPNASDCMGFNPLHYAGNVAVAKLLLQYGAHIDAKDDLGGTPLSYAVEEGDEERIKAILEGGADPNAGNNRGRAPLLKAVAQGHSQVAELLLASGANTEIRDISGNTPLLLAVWLNRMPEINTLIIRDFHDIKVTDKQDCTADFEAAEESSKSWIDTLNEFVLVRPEHTSIDPYMSIVNILLKNGANIEAKDNDGRTPLLVAAREGCRRMMMVLLENGANVEATGPFNRTPLFVASATGRQKLVQVLAERGAKLDVVDTFGNTPVTVASAKGHEDIVTWLQSRKRDGRIKKRVRID